MSRLPLCLVLLLGIGCSSSSTTPSQQSPDAGAAGTTGGNTDSATPSGTTDVASISPDTAAGDDGGMSMTTPPMGNPAQGVVCGDHACTVEEKCCAAAGPSVPASCVPQASSCGQASVACDGPEDCQGGNLCCFGATGGNPPAATCQAACSMTVRLCHLDGQCGAGEVCCAGQYPPDWGVAFRRCQPGPNCPEAP